MLGSLSSANGAGPWQMAEIGLEAAWKARRRLCEVGVSARSNIATNVGNTSQLQKYKCRKGPL